MDNRLLIWNGGSGKAEAIDELRKSLHAGSEIELARGVNLSDEITEAVVKGCKTVVAAGGDGTVNAVVNAMMQIDAEQRPKLGIIPLGTANDFAGTLEIPDELSAAIELINREFVQPCDVVRISSHEFERFYANMAAGGNCVRVSEQLTDEIKQTWGPFCYVRSAAGVLTDMTKYKIVANCDDEQFELDSWAVLVANGKTNAGRIEVAPQASITDGLIDVVIIRDGNAFDMVEIVSKTLLGKFLDCEQVIFRQAKKLTLVSTPGMRFTIDGEVVDEEPIEFEVVRHAIQIISAAK